MPPSGSRTGATGWILAALAALVLAAGLEPALAQGTGASGGDWALFRGKADRTGAVGHSPGGNGTVHWNQSTGIPFVSSPAVAAGHIFVGNEGGSVVALDAGTGKEAWTAPTGQDLPRVRGSPAAAGDTVYAGGREGNLYAFELATGKLRWKLALGGPVDSSPAVADGVVYVGSDNGVLNAVDARRGDFAWRFLVPDEPTYPETPQKQVRSSPVVVNGIVYVAGYNGFVYALGAERKGEPLWSHNAGHKIHSSPAVVDGVVYVAVADGRLLALDAASGRLLWTYATNAPTGASPAVVDGTVFFHSGEGRLYAIEAATGRYLWGTVIGPTVSAVVLASFGWHTPSPAVANGVVYQPSLDGKFYAVDAATGAWRWNVTLSTGFRASPAVVDGVVFIGTSEGVFYALDAGASPRSGASLGGGGERTGRAPFVEAALGLVAVVGVAAVLARRRTGPGRPER